MMKIYLLTSNLEIEWDEATFRPRRLHCTDPDRTRTVKLSHGASVFEVMFGGSIVDAEIPKSFTGRMNPVSGRVRLGFVAEVV